MTLHIQSNDQVLYTEYVLPCDFKYQSPKFQDPQKHPIAYSIICPFKQLTKRIELLINRILLQKLLLCIRIWKSQELHFKSLLVANMEEFAIPLIILPIISFMPWYWICYATILSGPAIKYIESSNEKCIYKISPSKNLNAKSSKQDICISVSQAISSSNLITFW